jgi:hypothetical protein
MSEEELNAIEARANAATAGPWAYTPAYINAGKEDIALLYTAFGDGTEDEPLPNAANNAAFIAHARNDVPALMAYIRDLQTEQNRYDTHAISVALLHRAAATDGAHHKQWLIVRILETMGEDISAYEEGVQP